MGEGVLGPSGRLDSTENPAGRRICEFEGVGSTG
jgi:hypothetical protein